MSEKFTQLTQGITIQLAKMHKEMPELMTNFSALSQIATKEGVLDKKSKE